MAWLGLALLLIHPAHTHKERFQQALCFGLGAYGVGLIWFWGLHPLTWVGLNPWQSLGATALGWLIAVGNHTLLFALLVALAHRRGWLLPLLWALGWALFPETPFGVPLFTPEMTQMAWSAGRTLAGWLGGAGLSVLIVAVNVGLSKRPWQQWPLILTGLLGLLWLVPPPPVKPLPFPVAVVQAALPIHTVRRGQGADQYQRLLQQAQLPPGTLVLLPEEGPHPGWVDLSLAPLAPYQTLAEKRGWHLVLGTLLTDGHTAWNALTLLPSGQVYQKHRLVPFGEVFPGLDLIKPWFPSLNFSAPFTPGPRRPRPWQLGTHRLLPLVCLEVLYPADGRQGDLWLVSSNLGWFQHQPNPLLERQYLAFAQLRAAESRTPLILAANEGVSAIINGHGTPLRTLPSKTPGVAFYSPSKP
jgi:apolipoprotein N-acyltransferase